MMIRQLKYLGSVIEYSIHGFYRSSDGDIINKVSYELEGFERLIFKSHYELIFNVDSIEDNVHFIIENDHTIRFITYEL